jgi:DNA repair protein RadC
LKTVYTDGLFFYMENNKGIKSWDVSDRPREKLIEKGKDALSTSELLAILIGHGTVEKSAVDLRKQILNLVNNDLSELQKIELSKLKKVKGIGSAKAAGILAALELSRRIGQAKPSEKPKISCSADIYKVLKPYLHSETVEHLILICLNNQLEVVQLKKLSSGGRNGTVVDLKVIFKYALEENATSIIIAHNHPSGNLKPSDADKKITKGVKEAGEFMSIKLLDHLIYTDSGFYSFSDQNEL